MKFYLERRGVGKVIFARIIDALRSSPKSTVYWVSYNAHQPPDLTPLLPTIAKYGASLRILVRHPTMAGAFEQIITRATLALLADQNVKVRGLKSSSDDEEVPEDMADIDGGAARDGGYGKIHAKMIVAESHKKNPILALAGSFNASSASLTSSCETIVEIEVNARSEEDAAERMLEEARSLWDRASPIFSDECNDLEHTKKGSVIVDGPATVGARRLPRETLPQQRKLWITDPFGPLLKLLEEKLRGYHGGWQWQIYGDLANSPYLNEILYLPVGCGKTFIALYWLVKNLAEGSTDGIGVYIAPNRWIEQTVSKRLNFLYEQIPKTIAKACRERLLVARASTIHEAERIAIRVAVADEVHNWAPSGHGGPKSYTGLLDELRERESVPILGLSATPCRMEEQKFRVSSFIDSWLGDSGAAAQRHRPLRSVQQMTELGVIVPLRFERIGTADVQREITSLLESPEIEMGDYSKIALHHVWDALAGTSQRVEQLVKQIRDNIAKFNSRRVVIFLPPVGDDAYAPFLLAVKKSLSKAALSVGDFIAHQGSSAQPPLHVFKEFSSGSVEDGLRVLLTIDRFSEGVSVDDIDMLVMLRATLSPRVAVQQVGRGVRTHPTKSCCVVLDAVMFKQRWEDWENPDRINGNDEYLHERVDSSFHDPITLNDRRLGKYRRITVAGIRSLAPNDRDALVSALGWAPGTFSSYLSSDPKRIFERLRKDENLRMQVIRAMPR